MIRIGDVSGRDGLSFFRAHFGYSQRLGAGRKVGVVSSAPSPPAHYHSRCVHTRSHARRPGLRGAPVYFISYYFILTDLKDKESSHIGKIHLAHLKKVKF